MLEAALVIAVLAVSVAGTRLPKSLIAFRVAPAGLLIAALWVGGLLLLRRAGRGLPWHESGEAPDNQDPPSGHAQQKKEKGASDHHVSTARAGLVFGVSALATLVAASRWSAGATRSAATSACPASCSGQRSSAPRPPSRRSRPAWPRCG